MSGQTTPLTSMPHVYVGMSGGVDSSVTAALLLHQGYRVTGVYMKNWTQDLPGMKCPWADDLADAKRVAVQLGIPFKVFDFQEEYRQKVVDYMIAEYQAGRTPNPDVMCNQEIKFRLFLDTALENGADMIATGHYARVKRSDFLTSTTDATWPPYHPSKASGLPVSEEFAGLVGSQSLYSAVVEPEKTGAKASSALSLQSTAIGSPPIRENSPQEPFPDGTVPEQRSEQGAGNNEANLLMGLDKNKDQSYFLYRITEEALQKTLFPVGELTKPEVRQKAEEFGLVTATKKDSQGICFVGEVGIKDFLQQYVTAEPGDIIDKVTGKVVGQHEGAIFYTMGQRHGLGVGGGLPYYVVDKDMDNNIVFVTTNINDGNLWQQELILGQLHWINQPPTEGRTYQIRTRYRAQLVSCTLQFAGDGELKVQLQDQERAITPGQSAVIYDGDRVVGGGIVR